MRIVLDTNVLIAGLLSPFGAPAQVLQMLLAGKLRLCYDLRILTEYRQVTSRAEFGFDPRAVAQTLASLENAGEMVIPSPWALDLPDSDDAAFLEVAAAGKADCLVTGNLRHFPLPKRRGLRVMTPAQFLGAADVRNL